jgi:hypothetical protein
MHTVEAKGYLLAIGQGIGASLQNDLSFAIH